MCVTKKQFHCILYNNGIKFPLSAQHPPIKNMNTNSTMEADVDSTIIGGAQDDTYLDSHKVAWSSSSCTWVVWSLLLCPQVLTFVMVTVNAMVVVITCACVLDNWQVHQIVPSSKVRWKFKCRVHKDFVCTLVDEYIIFKQ